MYTACRHNNFSCKNDNCFRTEITLDPQKTLRKYTSKKVVIENEVQNRSKTKFPLLEKKQNKLKFKF